MLYCHLPSFLLSFFSYTRITSLYNLAMCLLSGRCRLLHDFVDIFDADLFWFLSSCMYLNDIAESCRETIIRPVLHQSVLQRVDVSSAKFFASFLLLTYICLTRVRCLPRCDQVGDTYAVLCRFV